MQFSDLYNRAKEKSDKGTRHDYITGFYCPEFTPRRYEELYIVEIGIYRGRSLLAFQEWFTNSTIVGIDNCSTFPKDYWTRLLKLYNKFRNVGIIYADAYQPTIANIFPDNSIDYLIDDGPHTIQSQIIAVNLYWPKIKPGGKLIIEDIQDIKKAIPVFNSLNIPYQVIDLRKNKGRYDDVLIIFEKW